jgi:hypothetical protein
MLNDELARFKQYINKDSDVCFIFGLQCNELSRKMIITVDCNDVRLGWNRASFSDASNHSLTRYFSYHLEGIREISDTLFEIHGDTEIVAHLQQELIGLVDYQRKYFRKFFDEDIVAPVAYYQNLATMLSAAIAALNSDLEQTANDDPLKACVMGYLNEMLAVETGSSFTFRSLFYFESVVIALHGLHLSKAAEKARQLIVDTLISLNFNHLGFFEYQRQQLLISTYHADLWKKLEMMEDKLIALKCMPNSSPCYDPAWPSLNEMLCGWLNEETQKIRNTLNSLSSVPVKKLPFSLSVAQLAFVIKLFNYENLFNNPNLTDIFKFFASNTETKKQKQISARSLSKEFYKVDQVTAAIVRNLLQKMIGRINRDFFPVVAVIVAASHVCLNLH